MFTAQVRASSFMLQIRSRQSGALLNLPETSQLSLASHPVKPGCVRSQRRQAYCQAVATEFATERRNPSGGEQPHPGVGTYQSGRFTQAESVLGDLLATPDLDVRLRDDASLREDADRLKTVINQAVQEAYSSASGLDSGEAHLFLQRILYSINRLVFFWYDDLTNYDNERSLFLIQIRDSIEGPWQNWEDQQLQERAEQTYGSPSLPTDPSEVKRELRRLAAVDVDPPLSTAQQFVCNELSLPGYKHLLAMTSLDGLVEASRQSRVCAGVGNEISCMVFRVLSEEYGNGRLYKKHSTFFAKMMAELGLNNEPEHYLDLVPWQLLSAINHNFLLTERRRFYLRYLGGLTFFELNGPSIYKTYLAAARRLGLSQDAAGYWELHIKEDERHGAQMVADVALPLVDAYPAHAEEVLRGYLQEKWIGERAGAAMIEAIKLSRNGGRAELQ